MEKTIEFYQECLENGRYLLSKKLEYAMKKGDFILTSEWVNSIRIWLYQTAVVTGLMNLKELQKVLEQLHLHFAGGSQ